MVKRSVFSRLKRKIFGRGGIRKAVGRGIKGLRSRLRLKGRRLGMHATQASGNRAAQRGKRKAMRISTSMPASRHDKENN